MGGEPWCFTPREIADLTDHQILHLYILPAVEKAEEHERRQKGLPPTPGNVEAESLPPAEAPSRPYMVSVFCEFLGMTVEQANREYDRQLDEFEKQKRERV